MAGEWPIEELSKQAVSIGPALLSLAVQEARWIHRRVERVELLSSTQAMRSVAADLTVPTDLAPQLGLYARESERRHDKAHPARYVVPLGLMPKGALEEFSITPADTHRLTAEQTNVLLVAALTQYASGLGASEPDTVEILTSAGEIALSEQADSRLLNEFKEKLSVDYNQPARSALIDLVSTLDENYILAVAVKADPGIPLRISFSHRQRVQAVSSAVEDPPLIMDAELPFASPTGPPYRVEVIAPDGLEIETASIAVRSGGSLAPIVEHNAEQGDGMFAQLAMPRGQSQGGTPHLQVWFGWPAGAIHQVGFIAGLATIAALAAGTGASLVLGQSLPGSSAGTLLAAPGLVSSLALGFATTRVTSKAVNRLRAAALVVALLGVFGALAVSLIAGQKSVSNREVVTLQVLLGLLTFTAALVTFAFPGRAVLRTRARLTPQSTP